MLINSRISSEDYEIIRLKHLANLHDVNFNISSMIFNFKFLVFIISEFIDWKDIFIFFFFVKIYYFEILLYILFYPKDTEDIVKAMINAF